MGGKRMGKHGGTFDIERGVISHHAPEQGDVGRVESLGFFDGFLHILTGMDGLGNLSDLTR